MPKLHISVPHELGADGARDRIKKILSENRDKLAGKISDFKDSWSGNTQSYRFRAMGFDVDGTLEARDTEVVLQLNYPWAAAPFKGSIEKEITRRAAGLLAKDGPVLS